MSSLASSRMREALPIIACPCTHLVGTHAKPCCLNNPGFFIAGVGGRREVGITKKSILLAARFSIGARMFGNAHGRRVAEALGRQVRADTFKPSTSRTHYSTFTRSRPVGRRHVAYSLSSKREIHGRGKSSQGLAVAGKHGMDAPASHCEAAWTPCPCMRRETGELQRSAGGVVALPNPTTARPVRRAGETSSGVFAERRRRSR